MNILLASSFTKAIPGLIMVAVFLAMCAAVAYGLVYVFILLPMRLCRESAREQGRDERKAAILALCFGWLAVLVYSVIPADGFTREVHHHHVGAPTVPRGLAGAAERDKDYAAYLAAKRNKARKASEDIENGRS